MSFLAKLFINDEVRTILNARQVYSRFADLNGKPTTKPFGGKLEFTIESTRDDSFFYENMFSPVQKCKGEIVFYKRDGLSTLFKMEFANAQILNLSEHFNANGTMPLQMEIKIGWGIMRIKNIIFEEKWNPNNPFVEIEETVLERNNEEKITECYYTDLEGNKEVEVYTGEEVYLVIKTENMVGKTIDINLSDHSKDFTFENEILENDIIKDFNVTANTHKIKLKVIAPQPKPINANQNIMGTPPTAKRVAKSSNKVNIKCDCGKKDFDKKFQCTRYGSVYGPVYWGSLKLESYRYWGDLINNKKVTKEEKEILVGMSENEGKLDSVQSYDSEILTVGAMQKTVNLKGKGEFPIQVQEFKNNYPKKYKDLFENCGWTVENGIMYYKDISDSNATKITGKTLKTKIREGFKSTEFKKKLKCKPLEPIAKASQDKDFQAQQVKDFINRLKNKVLPIKPKGYTHKLSNYVKSKLGKATVLDHHINRPGYVKKDFGKALDNFFSKKDKEILEFNKKEKDKKKHKSKISKDPKNWGNKHSDYEKEILDDYGIKRRGTDMKGRYNKMKNKFK